jgi:predicted kinase
MIGLMEILKTYRLDRLTLCLIVGVPASGKTTTALQLARQLVNSAYLSKDLIQSAFTDQERIEGEIYSMIQGPTFHILVDFCAVQLNLGKHPIIDAPFSINHRREDDYSDWIPFFNTAAKKRDARLTIIRCLPPNLDELKNRIQQRGYDWDKWKIDHWEEFIEREPVDFPIRHDDVLEVVSNQPVENMVDLICIKHLDGLIVTTDE